MNPDYLDFEQPIAELDGKIEELRHLSTESGINIADEVARLRSKSKSLTEKIFSDLSIWQKAQLARHPKRPYTLDYVKYLVDGFDELHGDRQFADDQALVGGIGEFRGRSVLVIGHEKGRAVKEKVARNFGMPRPEGYRKAQRLMALASRFKLPILTFIDTPGAYPGIDAEERGQSEAIAKSLALMSRLNTPIITSVIGEGGSGGALAIGVCDRLLMLEYATYSVISPEGCASILWKNASHAPEAAEAMGITADRLFSLGLVDQLVREPLGGAHRAPADAARHLGDAIEANLDVLAALDSETLLQSRYDKLMAIGVARS
ncbi:MAG: acetyl-CoA carboxylase carboxyltransferase subunit alpha [Litorivicinaceae bacterium]|jgi:acetyl-CoA carboxylase carboxyl transferase subunit alpha|nr:acetyl-CoA carboxylase carboxyltransferase subunit alpha [Litorivicinaceae bacterium]MDP5329472.1 acetyl-CoA carboxylase carboxyltransferase subunit alpha [Litorivicinaceae bacterium]MDP5331052.1 acetyl-CoA carboxylase carboxyltransferase subunit alpha [Litorivicinaceae bacterium]MDP5339939.1 acetyl-CoA carboxylase carboxyltransferase subunit alpha [Litorivicinaceae bacterium]MDP5342720.1 acetyl-CoA carboxylase carboxyltransferase subunit alpha [Litorivicinaceae bacterium]